MLKVNENLKSLLQSDFFFSPKKLTFILHSKWSKERGQARYYQMCLIGHETNMDLPVESLLCVDKFSLKVNNLYENSNQNPPELQVDYRRN